MGKQRQTSQPGLWVGWALLPPPNAESREAAAGPGSPGPLRTAGTPRARDRGSGGGGSRGAPLGSRAVLGHHPPRETPALSRNGTSPPPVPRRSGCQRSLRAGVRAAHSFPANLSPAPPPLLSPFFPTYFSHDSSLPFPGTAAGCFLTPRSLPKDLPGGSSALPAPRGTLHTEPQRGRWKECPSPHFLCKASQSLPRGLLESPLPCNPRSRLPVSSLLFPPK